jgi:hypothetical protein
MYQPTSCEFKTTQKKASLLKTTSESGLWKVASRFSDGQLIV